MMAVKSGPISFNPSFSSGLCLAHLSVYQEPDIHGWQVLRNQKRNAEGLTHVDVISRQRPLS